MTAAGAKTSAGVRAPTPRLEDWPGRLAGFFASRALTPFAWGRNDCCSFAAAAVEAMTGVDPSRAWRAYRGPRGAAARLAATGGVAGVIEAAASRHGWPEIAVAYARRGDCVLIGIEGRYSLAIVAMDGREAWGPGGASVIAQPVLRASRAWSIG